MNAYELLRDEAKRFNSPEMRACRARLASALLASRRDFEKIDDGSERVCAFFEDIGLLLRRRVVPVYYIWSMLSYEILHCVELLRDYVSWLRKTAEDQTFYTEFDLLRERVAALQRRRSGLEPAYSEDELRAFLEDETQTTTGTDAQKGAKPRRRRIQTQCPHCKKSLTLYLTNLARKRKCPHCSGEFTLKQVGS